MSSSDSARHKSRFRGDIQGLRGIAVLAVVAAHVGVPGLSGGFLGVDVFYVISGFLIAGLMYREANETGRISILGFYRRRARRILPAALIVLGVVLFASRCLMNPVRAANVANDATWSAFFAVNVHFIHQGTDYFSQGAAISPLQHYWSLAVEEQFYLVMPFLFVLVFAWTSRKPGRTFAPWIIGVAATLSAVSLAWSIRATGISPTSAYFSSLTRAWQLGAGAVLGLIVVAYPQRLRPRAGTALGFCGLAGLAVSVAVVDGSNYPGAIALLPTASTAMLLGSGNLNPDGPVQRLLSGRWLGQVGLVSFSLYLWHWPLIVFANFLWPSTDQLLRIPLLLASSLMVSAASYKLIEQPFMRSSRRPRPAPSRRFRSRRLQVGLVGCVLFSGLISVAPALTASSPMSLAMSRHALAHCATARYQTATALWTCKLKGSLQFTNAPHDLSPPLTSVLHDRENSGCLNVSDANVNECRWGSSTARKTVALIGDSHAEMWLTPLKATFPPDRFVIQALTMGRCPNSDITRSESQFPSLGKACDDHRRWVWKYLAQMHPDIIVMSDSEGFRNWLSPDGTVMTSGTVHRWATGLQTSLRMIRPYAPKIVLIGQTPRAKRITECLPKDLAMAPCFGDSYMALQRAIEQQAVTNVGGAFVDPGPWLCYHESCPPIIDGTAAFWDNSHLTRTMAQKLTPELKTAVAAALKHQRRYHVNQRRP